MRKQVSKLLAINLALLVGVCGLSFPSHAPEWLSLASIEAAAQEDDGDDDDGDDDDDDDDDGGSSSRGGGSGNSGLGVRPNGPPPEFIQRPLNSLRGLFGGNPPPRRQQARRQTPPPEPLPERAERELTALGLGPDAITTLEAQGYQVAERNEIALVGGELVKLVVPDGTTLEAARETVAGLVPDATVDFNHFYRPEQADEANCEGMHCPARQLIGWQDPARLAAACGRPARIGLIDTGINPDHESFADGGIEILERFGAEDTLSDLQHGTAVAALLVGAESGRLGGLLPGAELVAVDAFVKAERDDNRADVFNLVRAMDLLADEEIGVLNMSLAGPPNALLAQAVEALEDRSIIIVAAAGNEGPQADPVYPAAYDGVIAVTAVDRNRQPYRRAGRGEHIDVAAPGVEVWTAASISGARPKTGTSFAAPFVTAAASLAKSGIPDLDSERLGEIIAESAEDIGDPGRDPVFGWGLLNAERFCEAVRAQAGEAPNVAGAPAPAAFIGPPMPDRQTPSGVPDGPMAPAAGDGS